MAILQNQLLAPLPALTHDEIARYSRHLILPEVGMEGQQKLKAAKVLLRWHGRPRRAPGAVPRRSGYWHVWVWWTSMWSMQATCIGKSSTARKTSAGQARFGSR